MHFMYLQEAANVFGNFTVKYLNITHGKDQPGVDEFRTESIFRVAVAFEKFALSYGKYHLNNGWITEWRTSPLTDWMAETDWLSFWLSGRLND